MLGKRFFIRVVVGFIVLSLTMPHNLFAIQKDKRIPKGINRQAKKTPGAISKEVPILNYRPGELLVRFKEGIDPGFQSDVKNSAGGQKTLKSYKIGRQEIQLV